MEMYEPLFDLLFEMARNADAESKNLADFVDLVRDFKDEQKKVEDLDVLAQTRDCVKIMTIHKSKGLEFPIVFVCGISARQKSDANTAPVFISQKVGAVVNTPKSAIFGKVKSSSKTKTANYFYDIAKAQNDAETSAELRRLVYVAFTRAEKELYITGTYNGKFDVDEEKNPHTIFQVLQPILFHYNANSAEIAKDSPFDFEEIPKISRIESKKRTTTENRENTQAEKAKIAQKLKIDYENAQKIQTEKIASRYVSPSHLFAEDEETAAFWRKNQTQAKFPEIDALINDEPERTQDDFEEARVVSFSYKNFGNMAHAYLESLFSNEKVKLKQEDTSLLSKANLEKAKDICEKLKEDFANSEIGKRALASEWKRAEFSFRAKLQTKSGEDKILRGTMDLVFKEADESYTIVDYKSGATLKAEEYKVQLACYRQALSQMFKVPKEKIRCHLFYLRFTRDEDITDLCEKIPLENLDIP